MLVVDIQLRDKVSRRGRREIALACSSCVLINLVIQTLTPSRHEIVCLLLTYNHLTVILRRGRHEIVCLLLSSY